MSAVTETERYTATVDGPQTGMPRTAASVRQGLSDLADRTKWFLARIGDFLGIHKAVINVDAGTNTITVTAHGWSAAQPVRFSVVGGTLPGGLSASSVVYVRSPATDTFEVSATAGGAAINITTTGSGTIYVWPVVDAAAGLFTPVSGVLPAGTIRTQLSYIRDNFIKLTSLVLSTIDIGWSLAPSAVGISGKSNNASWSNMGSGVTVTNIVAGQNILFIGKVRARTTGGTYSYYKIGDAPNTIGVGPTPGDVSTACRHVRGVDCACG